MKKVGRQIYSAEFKAEAVQLVQRGDKDVTQIARELGVARQQLYGWVRQAEQRTGKPASEVFPGNGNRTAEQAELERLRRENAQLKEDNEILKKATAFFAKHHR
jgi:transposase